MLVFLDGWISLSQERVYLCVDFEGVGDEIRR